MKDKGYYPFIDGLRAVAILQVLWLHLGEKSAVLKGFCESGWIGVDTFFVISGFLITGLLLKERRATGNFDLRQFYWRRVFRILPAYYFSISAWALQRALFGQPQDPLIWWSIFFMSDVAMGHLHPFVTPTKLFYTWSLGVEEKFYMIWPWLLRFFKVRAWLMVLLLIPFAALYKYVWIQNGAKPQMLIFTTEGHLDALAFGALAAFVVASDRCRSLIPYKSQFCGLLVAGVFVITSLTMPNNGTDPGSLLWCLNLPFHCLAVAALLVMGTGQPNSVYAKALSLPIIRWIGQISYSLYLWHVFGYYSAQKICEYYPIPLEFSKIAITVALAAGAYYMVEKPANAFGKRFLAGDGVGEQSKAPTK